jgi:hypothetical protein
MHQQFQPSLDPNYTMESRDTSSLQNGTSTAVESLLSQLRLTQERSQPKSTIPNAHPLQANKKVHGVDPAVNMVSRAMSAPKTNDSMRLGNLLSTLPKLSIPTPLNPLKTFALFPKLPIDIRIRIWRIFALQPRRVKLFLLPPTETRHLSRLIDGQSKIPAIMHVSKEARAEGLRYYTLCKEDVWPSDPFKTYLGPNQLYINFDIDHFAHDVSDMEFVGNVSLESYTFGPEVLKRIKFVDILKAGPGGPPTFIALRDMLRESENLVEFCVILNNLVLRSCRFYNKHDIGIEDFQLRDGAKNDSLHVSHAHEYEFSQEINW